MELTESLNLEDHFIEVFEKVRDEEFENISTRRYELLHHIISTVLVDPQKHSLEKILNQSHLLYTEKYSAKYQIGLIIYFESLKSYTDKILVSKLVKRVQSHLKREVHFFKLKNPESEFNHEICDRALASIDNLVPCLNKPSEDEMNVNVLLNEIIKYRQSTLTDEEAWDHIAQQILRKTKKAPS